MSRILIGSALLALAAPLWTTSAQDLNSINTGATEDLKKASRFGRPRLHED